MDCSQTEDGWFELKGFVTNSVGWEGDISQGACEGTAAGTPPHTSNNHFARCGHFNVFQFNQNNCLIDEF